MLEYFCKMKGIFFFFEVMAFQESREPNAIVLMVKIQVCLEFGYI